MNEKINVRYRHTKGFDDAKLLREDYQIKLVENYAGKLLQFMGSRSVIVYLGESDEIHVLETGGRLVDYETAIRDGVDNGDEWIRFE